jgi:hypothetical protein
MAFMRVEVRRAPHAGARAFAATVLVMAGAVGAHTAAGGHVPGGALLVALAALVLGGSLLAMHDTLSERWLLGVLAVGQFGLHAAFSAAPMAHDHASVSTGAVDHATWSWQMLLAHAGVTGLTALIWRWCSRAAVVLVELGAHWVGVVEAHPSRLFSRQIARPAGGLVCLSVAPRRGPPRLL